MLHRIVLTGLVALIAGTSTAQEKETACALQGDVVGAIQQARLDRVKEAEVVPTLMAANPSWEPMAEAMPQMVAWIYGLKRRELRGVELGPVAEAQCLDSWDQIQALTKN